MRKIVRIFQRAKFDVAAKKILNTAPLTYRTDPSVTVVSMVGHTSLNMYLLAIKSYMRNFGRGSIEVINDGSLTENDREILRYHVPNVQFSEASDVDTYDSPSYISWKRLYRVQKLAETSYVIQLDSDTLSLGPLIDVDDAILANRGFLIGCNRWSKAVDVYTLRDITSHWNSDHVQARAESIFHKLAFFQDGTRYLRGCAGFAGYPNNFASVEQIRSLASEIYEHVGDDWMKWGSEQTATLCLISKCQGSKILPWPAYQNFDFPSTNEDISSMNLIHFIGTNRYERNVYARLVTSFLKDLS